MNKRNLKKEHDEIIKNVIESGKTPRLLLHSCCAPCSSYVLEYLTKFFSITVFYYNPNIFPEQEYIRRRDEQIDFINRNYKSIVSYVVKDYIPEVFYNAVAGNENCPEKGPRCAICYRLRMEETAKYAKKNNFDFFTTTLTISPMKVAEKINEIGDEMAEKYKIKHLTSDFKKNNGYKRSIEISHEQGLYRQTYCGCEFSVRHNKNE